MFYIAIVGRPNVGKSTLFNKIIGGRPAIVDGVPGVTRDRNVALAMRNNRRFGVIDSGGFEPESREILPSLMREQTMMAVEEADIIFFVVDGRDGVTPSDEEIASRLRKSDKPVWLVINKVDTPSQFAPESDFARFGFDKVFPISAEHSLGIAGMVEEATAHLPEEPEPDEETETKTAMRIAVVGKPNAGKSSLVNKIIGANRMIVSSIAGTTRDAIDTEIIVNGEPRILIDTAGIRRKSKVSQKLEKFSVIMAIKAIDRADVALLLIDGVEGVSAQEAKIASLIEEAGKACVLVVNKWDLVEKDEKTTLRYTEKIRDQLKFIAHAPIVFVSAATGQRVDKIWEVVDEVYAQYIKRLPTAKLNEIVKEAVTSKAPTIYQNKRLKFYYTTQAQIKPPTFVFMTNYPEGLHFSYQRYLVNHIRRAGGFDMTPIRFIFRKSPGRRQEKRS